MIEIRKAFWQLGVVLFMASLVPHSLAAATVYSDDFSTDPAGAWTSANDHGYGVIDWDAGAEQVRLSVYSANPQGGYASYWTTATDSLSAPTGYSVDFDFLLQEDNAGRATHSVGAYVQRQTDNSRYRIRAYISTNGEVDWKSDGGGLTDVTDGLYEGRLDLNQWYTLHVEVADDGSQIEIRAVIYERGTTTMAVPWSATAIDSTPGRYTSCHGFGLQAGTTNGAVGPYVLLDNFTVALSTGQCGDEGTVYLAADVTGPQGIADCYVDMFDFELLLNNWLRCTDPEDLLNCEPYGYSVWLGNDLGKEETVPPPWTPVEVTGNNTVMIWGRSYVFNDIGLPQSLSAVGSDILDGAMRFVTVVDGVTTAFSPLDVLAITPGDTKATVESHSSAGNLQLQVATTVEFDGFARVDLTLTDPTGSAFLNKFWLEVPLAADNALFYMPTFIDDHDPAIPPEGIKAPVIGLSSWQQRTSSKLFWVGGDDRGLFLAAEHDHHWRPADREEAQELVPVANGLVWRYHFVDESQGRDMSQPLTLTYCFMATPVKPVDDWYEYRNSSDAGAWLLDGGRLQRAYDLGVRQAHFHEHWTEIMGYPGTIDPERISQLRLLTDGFKSLGMNLCLYTQNVISSAAPEFADWIDLWATQLPPVKDFSRDPSYNGVLVQDVYQVPQCDSWADFYIYHWKRMIEKFGINGVYLDGTYSPRVTTNPNYERAYSVDGEIRPTYTIFDAREFMKRWYRTCKQLDPQFFFQGHTSSGYIAFVPTTAFLDYAMAGETVGGLPAGSELPWSYWRAAQTGRQFGLQCDFYGTTTFPEAYAMPLALVHGGCVYGRGCADLIDTYQKPVWDIWDAFGINDAQWTPYWKNTGLIVSSHPDVKVSYYSKPEQVLLVAATIKRDKPVATVTIDLVGLGLDPGEVTGTYGTGTAFSTIPDPDLKLRLGFPEHNGKSILSNDGGIVNYVWLRSDR